jgi:hypothetical protein
MEAMKEFIKSKWAYVVIALVVGIALGVLYAWVISPVEWVDGVPSQMRQDLKVDYLRMVIDSYSMNLNPELAQQRYESLGASKADILAEVGENLDEISPSEIQKFQALVAVESPSETTSQAEEDSTGFKASKYVVPACITTFVLGALLAAALFIRRRMESRIEMEPAEHSMDAAEPGVQLDETPPSEQPLATFRSTYTLGDDTYDDSFSIESATGDFLGECGIGIGDVMGGEEPKKVSAYEVWLFDKNDIQTVTKVLMSPYTFNDEELRNRLSAKGDPVEAVAGGIVDLETASLRVGVRVVDMSYGEGVLPSESYFERLTVEIRAWRV